MTTDSPERGSIRLYRRLLSHLAPYKGVFAVAVIAMVITAVTDASFAALFKPIMDEGFVNPDPAFIKLIPWLLTAVILARALAGFVANYTMSWVGRRVVFDLRQNMFQRLVYLPSKFYDDHSSATLVSKMIYDVEQATTATTDALTLITKDSLTAVALCVWLVYLDWKLTLVFLVFAPLIAFGVSTAARKFRRTSERIQHSMGGIAHVAKEAIVGQHIVKTYGGQAQEIATFQRANNRNRQQAMKNAAVSAAMVPMILIIVGLAIAIVISISVSRSGTEAITAGTFVSYLTAVLMLMAPLKRLAKVNEKVQLGVAAANSVFGLIDELPEYDGGSRVIGRARGSVEYRSVSFRYERAEEQVLTDLSFRIEAGETVAMVGASGSGKSTIAALLLGFYRPDSGAIYLDGIDLKDITLDSLRANIGVVTQDTVLFDDTICNNIVYGHRTHIDEEKLRAVVVAAHVAEFVDRLPKGLDTVVGERGVRLSGGQRQRIAIARALYKDAPILLLDEATSSLDAVSERLIRDATEKLTADRTTLVIAHRLSTIENADRILVVDRGRIVESGRHPELVAQNGLYTRLYRSQMQDQERMAG